MSYRGDFWEDFMPNTYQIPADLLQGIVNVLNQRPAGEVFGLLVAIKAAVDRQNAERTTHESGSGG